MNDDPFNNSPDFSHDFKVAERGPDSLPEAEHDAERWEPWDEEYIERPSEPHYTLDLTPGGSIEQEVHTHVDNAARARILQAQRERFDTRDLEDELELDFAGDFNEARRNSMGFDPDSAREYEKWSAEQDAERSADLDAMLENMHRADRDRGFER